MVGRILLNLFSYLNFKFCANQFIYHKNVMVSQKEAYNMDEHQTDQTRFLLTLKVPHQNSPAVCHPM